jgi:hypothetical protein
MEKLKNKKTIAMILGIVLSVIAASFADVGEVIRDVCAQVAPAPVDDLKD